MSSEDGGSGLVDQGAPHAPARSDGPVGTALAKRRALVIGAGGLGTPALMALARAGIGRIIAVDDDIVELSNLHRQLLYQEADVGGDKLDAAARALEGLGFPQERFQAVRTRFLPDNALALVGDADIVIEGADNFATKFLAADACRLAEKPIVHGAAIRWVGTAWFVAARGRPCYRCLFEDLLPNEAAPNCASAGVMGPVVGMMGALMADLALRYLHGADPSGALYSYEGKRDLLRRVPVSARASCALCGSDPTIHDTTESRYFAAECTA